jgi:hypothetical protein
MRLAGRRGAAGGHNVETLHPVETFRTDRRFYFRRLKSFHANGGEARTDGAAIRRADPKGTIPPLS